MQHMASFDQDLTMTSRTTGEGLVPWDGVPPSGNSVVPASSVCEPLRKTVRIRNPYGLHQRAADRFARAAKQYTCSVTITNGNSKADGKDLWALISLMVFPDSDVILEVDGEDASAALEILAEVLGAPNGEDYTI
jgi:phosphocarrier protein HPr